MLIASDFHDYYDNCIVFGIDRSIVYHRKTKELGTFRKRSYGKYDSNSFPKCDLTDRVFFAKIMNAIQKYVDDGWESAFNRMPLPYHTYKNIVFLGGEMYTYFSTSRPSSYMKYEYSYYDENSALALKCRHGYNHIHSNEHHLNIFEIHRHFHCPLIAIRCNCYGKITCILNPSLSKLAFQRVLDPFLVRQSIENVLIFLNSIKSEDNNIPNDCKITGHGFDLKRSFRHR